MKEEKLEDIFKNIGGDVDFHEPKEGHRERFLEKLNAASEQKIVGKRPTSWWKPLSIAASIAVLIGLFVGNTFNTASIDQQISKISPEVSNTEFYFANLIEQQVVLLETESSPETQNIIDDTLVQLSKLEMDYQKLQQDLINGGNSKFILSAMIQNFQTRIDLLKEVQNQIKTIKNFKTQSNENLTV
ncbi:MAG: hypothetical protein HKN52_04145 [Eudoraea sp.]|nr:nitrate- and nitrite sensing domain-containing protein [Muriicola sp.]NNE02334.1 hypothetical protein [Eudoraea sp.]